MKTAFVIVLLLTAACGGAAASPSPVPTSASPSPTATKPSPTASAAPSASPTPIVLPSIAQVSAPSSNVVWTLVAGSRLFRSTDRGGTWDEHALPSMAINPEISFVTDREGWLASVGSPATQCQSQSISIWHTTDAGATWQQAATTGIADAQCKRSLSFTDAEHGFVGAWDQNHAPLIYRTTDGAKTWSASRPLPDPPGFTTQAGGISLQAGRVLAFGSTLLVTATGPAQAGTDYVFRSQDGGATWTYAASVSNMSIAFAIVTASRWLRIGPPGGSFETTDAGATWHAYVTDYSQAAPIAPALVFGDASVGYATVRGGLQRTVDGGAHWTQLKTPGTE